jgi:serine/threonine-protein kinase
MIGQTVSHYKILEKLGEGGMGVVYKAGDTKLKRTVALKFLPPSISDATARKRFVHEAQAASSLEHPNICSIHEIDETPDGRMFIVMPCYEGETLQAKIEQGPMKIEEAVSAAIQVASGLSKAHEKGIVHRDIKPGNVFITDDDLVKIVDFGLAKLASQPKLTKTGITVGTVPYMSPEQAGDNGIDHRTDVWAVGVLIYEMITGRLPFRGSHEMALVYSIINEAPEPMTAVRTGVPMELERIVAKSLAKNPAERYPHIQDMLVDLRAIEKGLDAAHPGRTVTQPVTSRKRRTVIYGGIVLTVVLLVVGKFALYPPQSEHVNSIAVLPLEDLSGESGEEYFADGLTEALIADLAKIGSLRVISRTTVMQYKKVRKPLPEIARDLNVDAILVGAVLRSGGRVRVTAQLIHGEEDRHIWSKSYEEDLRDILQLQSNVARAIASEIEVKLTPQDEARLSDRRSVNPEAHKAYLRGRFHWNKRSQEGLEKALEYFQRAIQIDPEYAAAHAGLADSYVLLGEYTLLPPKLSYPKALDAAMTALALDSTLADAHTALAAVKQSFDWDFSGAERSLKKAIELNPGYAIAHQWYAENLQVRGRFEEALVHFERALEIDPLSPMINVSAGYNYLLLERHESAFEQASKSLEIDPDFAQGHRLMGLIYLDLGRYEDAIEEIKKTPFTLNNWYLSDLGYAHATAGARSEALRILTELEAISRDHYVSPFVIALVYLGLGEKDHALGLLEKSYEERDVQLTWVKASPFADSLRSEPRFTALLEKMGLED